MQRSDTTELLIVLSEAERQSLRAGLIEDDGHKIVTQMLVDIDVEEAKAEQESDHRQLSVRLPSVWLRDRLSLTALATCAGAVPRDGGRLPPRQCRAQGLPA